MKGDGLGTSGWADEDEEEEEPAIRRWVCVSSF